MQVQLPVHMQALSVNFPSFLDHFSGRIQQCCKETLCFKMQPLYWHDGLYQAFPFVVPIPIFQEFYLPYFHLCFIRKITPEHLTVYLLQLLTLICTYAIFCVSDFHL